MSQLTRIRSVDVQGASVFLGLSADGSPMYSSDPDMVVRWLCDGWRSRFNQLRSRRKKHGPDHELIPLGGAVNEQSQTQARRENSWMTALPDAVLSSTQRLEHNEWFAGVHRRKTLKKQGKNPGRMPRFKSRKLDDLRFTCWYHSGQNARFTKFNRHHGMVSITGQNPKGYREHGTRWQVRIHVRLSQPIRPYTSVHVNWTKKTLAFTNPPQPIRHEPTGKAIGIDRGVAHAAAQSDCVMLDLPVDKLKAIDREISRRQRAMARKAKLSGKSRKQYVKDGPSNAYVRERGKVKALYAKRTRIVTDVYQKYTTQLVRDCDTIIIEALNLPAMTRKAKAKPAPEKPGQYLPNGQAAKKGLNRVLTRSNLGLIRQFLAYKAENSAGDTLLVEVNPAYTSQTCFQCGHISKENRESQADFTCTRCGHHANADINAAKNILEAGLQHLVGLDEAERETRVLDIVNTLREHDAAFSTRKPQHS